MNKMTFVTFLLGLSFGGFEISSLFNPVFAQVQSSVEETFLSSKIRWPFWRSPEDTGAGGDRRRGSGAKRSCLPENTVFTALVPEVIEGRVGVEAPVLYMHISGENLGEVDGSIEFYTYQDGWREIMFVHQEPLTPNEKGIVAISLPQKSSLDQDGLYFWKFTSCTSQVSVDGALSLEPETISEELLERLNTSSSIEKVQLYMSQGWWYDALKILMELRETEPDNPEVVALWTELLTAEGLEDLI